MTKDSFTCLKQNSKLFKPPSANLLPTFRLNIDFPFANIGIDYLGPLFVRNIFYGNIDLLFKVCIALYTYASTRAVYIDVVPDASSRSLVNSMKRFLSQYGIAKIFISENGTNFIGTEVKIFKYRVGLYPGTLTLAGRVLGKISSISQKILMKHFKEE